jgi:hypothetical protein
VGEGQETLRRGHLRVVKSDRGEQRSPHHPNG